MTKQYRITTENLPEASEEDCFLEADDPIHELKAASIMGGLGARVRLAAYNEATKQATIDKIQAMHLEARKQGIKPGSVAWHALFSNR
jgi:hypothetical protein